MQATEEGEGEGQAGLLMLRALVALGSIVWGNAQGISYAGLGRNTLTEVTRSKEPKESEGTNCCQIFARGQVVPGEPRCGYFCSKTISYSELCLEAHRRHVIERTQRISTYQMLPDLPL